MKYQIILTDDMLARWNHLRFRANVPELTRKEALELMKMWKDEDIREHLERIGRS